ncbi:MAG: cellulose binding domain-containing protein [Terracidiphilus sp.]
MFHEFNPPCRRARARRLSGYLAVLAALLLTLVAPSAYAANACNVVYTISPQNSSQFGATITIENTGTTAWTSWSLTWTFANGQTIANSWNGTVSQSGANVTVSEQSGQTWENIPAGGSYSGFGFNGTWNGTTNAVPTSFAVNGTTCGATGSFTLKPSAFTLSIAQGASGTGTITITDVSPFTGSVTLAATGLPTGVTAAFATNPATSTSVLTLTASATATAGTSTVTITGTSRTLTATTTIALTVTAKVGFTLAPSAPALSVAQGKTATDTITVTDVGGFTGSVTLAATGLPSGVTVAYGTNPTTTTSVLTFTATAAATVGTYTVTITGTSGTLTATTTITLTVTTAGSGYAATAKANFLAMYGDMTAANGYSALWAFPITQSKR